MSRVLIASLLVLLATPLEGRPALARAMETGEAAVAQLAMPAVVNISSWKLRPASNPGDPARRVKTYGSGFIIDSSGIIVTNKHVIDGALNITVIFDNGDRKSGKLLAVAAMLDVAVVKVDVDHPLPTLKWGDSNALRVGDPVLTIGNPLGLGMSVSAGIVSALNRDIQDTPFDNYIQTDSAINHGNSGGPMIDTDGDVVGVDTALYNPEEAGGFIGIGFAIPADSAKFVVEHLLDPKHPPPGWLGVTLQDMTEELALALGVGSAKGSIISAVDEPGPAVAAGLRPGDILLAIDGTQPSDSRAYMRRIVQLPVGRQVRLTIWRDGKADGVTATVGEWPNHMPEGGMMTATAADAMIQRMPDPGVRLSALGEEARKQYGIDPKIKGVLIASVEKDCEARDLGIVPGDVITAVQGAPVATPDDVRRSVRTAHDERRPYLAVLIQGKSGARWVSLSMGGPGS
ncbi:MAG TPA: trypsin-like peptidase domain-containing protein [Acetobacteraceae bacterium]|jgi:serine protease Do